MLLKEINHGELPEPAHNSEPPSTTASPIKPLKCTPTLKESDQFSNRRDFNSSSDTYVSEAETDPHQPQGVLKEPHLDSFTRNFEPDSSADLSKATCEQPSAPTEDDPNTEDDFPVEQELSPQELVHNSENSSIEEGHDEHPNIARLEANSSPSKSIMKGNNLALASPKKNVAFLAGPDLQTFHSYPVAEDESFTKKPLVPPMVHLWTELDHNSFDDNAETTQPPVPPPHSSHTVTGLLSMDEQARDEPDISQLTEYKLTHKNFSNLSLNEKIDVFLNNKPHDDLNEHLDNLSKAAKEETDVNIHRLSYQLATHEPTAEEDPLNALGNSLEYRLHSAHSSQSSLQSLVNSNKYLQSNHVEKLSKGLQLNDGIKGFSDKLATEIIPTTLESAESSKDQIMFEPKLLSRQPEEADPDVSNEDLNSPINQLQTEQSIMNLLNSVSQINLTEKEKNSPEDELPEDEQMSTNGDNGVSSKSLPELPKDSASKEPFVKEEQAFEMNEFEEPHVKLEGNNSLVKSEVEDIAVKAEPNDQLVKGEPNDDVADEQTSFLKEEPCDDVKQESLVSRTDNEDLARSSLATLPRQRLGSDSYCKAGSISEYLPMGNVVERDVDAITVQVEQTIVPGQVKLVGPIITQPGSMKPMSSNWNGNSSAEDTNEFANESNEGPQPLKTEHHNNLSAPFGKLEKQMDDVSQPPASVLAAPFQVSASISHALTSSDYDLSVLANSSNVQPPFNIKLPALELSDNEFDDLNKKLNEKSLSFEESLSAEHDNEKKSLDFLSIWHSQHLTKKSTALKVPKKMYQVPSLLFYNTADLSQCAKFHVPEGLKPKKFNEVNLVSTKVVSLSYENLYDSQFLPELSQDSGIEDHFNVFFKDASIYKENPDDHMKLKRRSSTGSERLVQESVNHRRSLSNNYRQPVTHSTLKPKYADYGNRVSNGPKKSRFAVPSFEIKRSSSILSPKNMYNDIFQDGSFVEPTIKSSGMKTLPSMDKDKIRKIIGIKEAIILTEKSEIKRVGKPAMPEEKSTQEHDKVQQEATVHCDSLVSDNFDDAAKINVDIPHVVSEMITNPVAIKSSERVFEPSAPSPKDRIQSPKIRALKSNNPFLAKSTDSPIFPDPDPDLVSTPYCTPVVGLKVSKQRRKNVVETPVTSSPAEGVFERRSPGKQGSAKGSPIKISSPVRLVKKGGSVTGVVLEKKPPVLAGKDITNIINNFPAKPFEKKSGHALSTVSVPTIPTADCLSTTAVEIMVQGGISESSTTQALSTIPKSRQVSSETNGISLEKGKLFLRVMGLKNVKLPEMNNRSMSFNLTLDNGVHCVKTPNYDTAGTANIPIGKEFELTVTNSLQFILTLKATYEKPRDTLVEVKERRVVQSRKKLSKLFGSREIITTTRFIPKEAEDSWKNLFATDGLFARCYVDLEQYLSQVTGCAKSFNLTCFNEWATLADGSGRSCDPYSIAQLEVKMLYVPRTEAYEILPLSIKSAYECLDDLKRESLAALEGYLHQEGGDCDSWKKRWFKLQGTALIAHSEYSHKTRAKINLTKVSEVVYVDQENINRSSSNYRNFSDILLMEHAFKIRFADGEIIDFGAPNKQEKIQWIQAIQEIVYRNKFRRLPWVSLMMEKNGDNKHLIKF